MNFQNYFAAIVLLFLSVNLLGQEQQIMIPQIYEEALKKTTQRDMSFRVYPYVGAEIDVREMKELHPDLKIEDFVSIVPPHLDQFEEVSTLMTVVEDTHSDDLQLIIWLAGDYNTNHVTFYIDTYSSRNFKNAEKLNILGGKKPKKVNLYPFGKEGRTATEMFIRVPKTHGNELDKLVKTRKYKNRIYNKFAIGGFAGFGSGNVHHNYISTETNYPGWYDVVLSEKLLGMTASKYFGRFKIELKGTYQNIFQYTSYFKLRYAPPETTFTSNGVRVLKQNLRVETNQDRHSRHRLKLGLNVAPRIKLSNLMEIQPSVGYGYIFFLNEPYLANKHEGHIRSFDQEKTPFYEFGLNAEMTVGNNRALSIGFFYNIIDWQPVGYFESIEGVSLTRYYNGYNLSVGYTFGL